MSQLLGSDYKADLKLFQEIEDNGYGKPVKGLIAKDIYFDALGDEGIDCLIITDDNNIGYNYGSNPVMFDSVSIEQVEECLEDYGVI